MDMGVPLEEQQTVDDSNKDDKWSKCANKHLEESDVETKEIEKAKQLISVKKRSN